MNYSEYIQTNNESFISIYNAFIAHNKDNIYMKQK